jgi:hypothetical protein
MVHLLMISDMLWEGGSQGRKQFGLKNAFGKGLHVGRSCNCTNMKLWK